MSTRADATTQVPDDKVPENKIEVKVNEIVGRMTKNDKGSWEIPADVIDESLRYAAIAERRRRDTQSDYTKVAQKAKALEAEKDLLRQKIVDSAMSDLSPEQKEELEQLKFEDPEEWRKRVNTLEKELKQQRAEAIDKEAGESSAKVLAADELERRKTVLDQFIKANPGFNLDDDVIANDIPPRITKKLETGKISFEEFLQECFEYTQTGKTFKQAKTMDQPNLSKVPGGSNPDSKATQEDMVSSYKKETY